MPIHVYVSIHGREEKGQRAKGRHRQAQRNNNDGDIHPRVQQSGKKEEQNGCIAGAFKLCRHDEEWRARWSVCHHVCAKLCRRNTQTQAAASHSQPRTPHEETLSLSEYIIIQCVNVNGWVTRARTSEKCDE